MNRFDDESYKAYINDIKYSKSLTLEEEREMLMEIKRGNKKIEREFYFRNLKFVISIAKEYYDGFLTLNDLINEGNLGLLKAMEKYDFSVETRFTTYAVWWIRQHITHSINKNSRTIRLPENVILDIKKNVNEKEIPKCVPLIFDEENEQFELTDYYIVEEENEENNDLKIMMNDIVNKLSKKDSEVIKMSFGLDGYDSMSLEEISKEMDLSKERVRQIKNTALRKLKHMSKSLLVYRNT